jgi:hypothetical protein
MSTDECVRVRLVAVSQHMGREIVLNEDDDCKSGVKVIETTLTSRHSGAAMSAEKIYLSSLLQSGLVTATSEMIKRTYG